MRMSSTNSRAYSEILPASGKDPAAFSDFGCPKLDAVDYSEKLTELFRRNDIRSVLVVRMQVPCCGGLTHAVETALAASGRDIPLRVVILTPSGEEVA